MDGPIRRVLGGTSQDRDSPAGVAIASLGRHSVPTECDGQVPRHAAPLFVVEAQVVGGVSISLGRGLSIKLNGSSQVPLSSRTISKNDTEIELRAIVTTFCCALVPLGSDLAVSFDTKTPIINEP